MASARLVTRVLEWWPDYGPGPLALRSGRGGGAVDLHTLGLSAETVGNLAKWNADYAEDKLPTEGGAGDPAWIAEGTSLLHEVRAQLRDRYDVVVTEPWWGEDPLSD